MPGSPASLPGSGPTRDDPGVKLLQIPFSHNSIKVRRALALKGLSYERENINPAVRRRVIKASGQPLTPVLLDNGRAVTDSTEILLYLEERYPATPLLPEAPAERAECLLLEDWADTSFMALTRRLAYWNFINSDSSLGDLFFPKAPLPVRRTLAPIAVLRLKRRFRLSEKRNAADEPEARRLARLAADRIGGRPFLVEDRMTIADVGLASMAMPLQYASRAVRSDPAVEALLAWGREILADEASPL
jgi:glutathione S-transferase